MDPFCLILFLLLAAIGHSTKTTQICYESKQGTIVAVKLFDFYGDFENIISEEKDIENWNQVIDEKCEFIYKSDFKYPVANITLNRPDWIVKKIDFIGFESNKNFGKIKNI